MLAYIDRRRREQRSSPIAQRPLGDETARRLARITLWIFVLCATWCPRIVPAQLIEPTRPLPLGRAFHGAAVLGDNLYVFGGTEDGIPNSAGTLRVLRAPIAPNGGLGTWVETTPLPRERFYIANSTLVLNDIVYILGGSTKTLDGEKLETTIYNRPDASGQLGAWKESPPIPGGGVSAPAAVSTPGFLHLIGGALGGTGGITDQVWSVPILAGGDLGEWEQGPTLPAPLWFHNAAVIAGRVVVWGGLNEVENKNPSTSVLVSSVLSTGRLSPWVQVQPQVPVGIYSAANAVVGPYIFSIFPRYAGGGLSSDVIWTFATPYGLQPWQRTSTPSRVRIYHPTAIDYRRGFIFIVGGKEMNGGQAITDTYYIRLSEEARRAAEQGWNALVMAGVAEQGQPAAGSTPGGGSGGGTATSSLTGESSELSYKADELVSAKALPGFVSLNRAMSSALYDAPRPMLIYFSSDRVVQCGEQKALLQSGDYQRVIDRATCAWVDVRDQPQAAQQRGIYRVPTWVVFDSAQQERGRASGTFTVDQLLTAVAGVQ